jgi:tricorn protease interacting factor F2/3
VSGEEQSPPEEYRLRLDVDFANLRWRGSVAFDLAAAPRSVRLDAEGLRIVGASDRGRSIPFQRGPHGDVTVERATNGPASLTVRFEGEVETRSLFGFYRSRYGDGYVLTTHCEPTGARKIFPCLDRPDRKAKVALTVRAAPDLEVIANTEAVEVRPVDGVKEWTFAPTPPMSTYLFYLAVGRFDRREERGGRVVVRVLTPPGRGTAGTYAAGSAGRILEALETYFGIPYPLPKLDLIAIPEHAFGAMENWGAISFQESRLLVDAASSTFARRDVFETAAHEIAHQWFGNLVTMAWWDDIWLNESFASLMETRISERIDPGLDATTDFFLRAAGRAVAVDGDSLRATHPVRMPVASPEELSQIFDEISYGKGSSVLAMLESYLGEEAFRQGVRRYLETFRYRNARTSDLWKALADASGEPVAAIADPWIDRPGLPLIVARLGPNGLELTQRRYGFLPMPEEEPWPIPLVLDIDGHQERLRFTGRTATVKVPPNATVHLNPGATGFYRVLYDPSLYDRLLAGFGRRSGPDRWSILDDLAAFVTSGDAPWATFASFVRASTGASDRLTVESVTSTLVSLTLAFPTVPPLASLAREFLSAQTDRIGLARRSDESPTDAVLRDRVTFCRARIDDAFAATIADRFAEWDRLDPDLRPAVAVARVRIGGEPSYRAVQRAHASAATDIDAVRLARALAWATTPELARETLDYALTERVNRSHIYPICVQAALNPAARPVLWPWLKANLERLTEMFRGSGYLPLVLEAMLPIAGLDHEQEIRAYFDAHPSSEGERGLRKGLERITILRQLAGNLPSIERP